MARLSLPPILFPLLPMFSLLQDVLLTDHVKCSPYVTAVTLHWHTRDTPFTMASNLRRFANYSPICDCAGISVSCGTLLTTCTSFRESGHCPQNLPTYVCFVLPITTHE